MAEVQLSGNRLVVVCRGTSRSTGVTIDPSQPDQIEAAVRRAISAAAPYFYGIGEAQGREVEAINASTAASAIRRSVARSQPAAQPTAPPAPTQTAPPARTAQPAAPPPARTMQQAAPQAPAPPRTEGRAEAPAAPARDTAATRGSGSGRRGSRTAEATPRPTITLVWLDLQLRDSRRDDRRAQAAANLLHSNSRFVETFLDPGLQRGVERTDAQKSVTISIFNQLYQIPSFRLYLSSMAAQQQALPERDRVFSEFVTLQAFLTEPGRGEQLSAQAESRIISAADLYIRYFLLNFVAANSDYSRYREEILQLPTTAWRLRNVEGARTFQPTTGRAPSDLDRAALMRLYISSPMDADTVTCASLYMRRWFMEHPERGNGRSQSRISQWRAPEIIQPEQRADATAQPVAQPSAVPAQPAATTVVPRVGIIGDSITAGGRYGRTLRTTLRTTSPEAVVDSYGVQNESISTIRGRFRRDILDHSPAYNTVVIQGGINGIEGLSVIDAESSFTRMISDARGRGMKVVLLTITPWAGYSGSTTEAQRRTAELNTWLRSQAQADGSVVVVDTSALGEGNPPRLRAAYDSGDGLHPNDAGRDLIAQRIAQAAFARAPTATETRTALQDFADRNWRSLPAEIYRHAQGGNPAGFITLTRNLPAGETSFEGALRTLSRDDIPRAYDRIFNEYLHTDRSFLDFCNTWREGETRPYEGVALASVTMSASSSPTDRRLVVRAIQAYLNYTAGRTGEDWYSRLRDDFRMMNRDVLGLTRDNLDVNGLEDVRTLAAVAVYSWRKGHRSEAVGAWATSLNITPRTTPPAQPVQPVVPPGQDGQRRRVIHPG